MIKLDGSRNIATSAHISDSPCERSKLAPKTSPDSAIHSPEGNVASFARQLVQERQHRNALFSKDYFSEPAWDILLDLFIAAEEKRKVSVSSLCIASHAPPTTALRWIKLLADDGILERHPDPHDGRRTWIELPVIVQMRVRSVLMSWQANRARGLQDL